MPFASRSSRLCLCAVVLAACGDGGASPAVQPSIVEEQPAGVAVIVRLTGDVRVEAAGSAHWATAEVGQALRARDSVQTMEGATAVVRFLETGAVTELGDGTTLVVPQQAPRVTRLRHLSGQLRARLDADGEVDRLEVALAPGGLVLEPGGAGEGGYAEARVEIHGSTSEIAMLRGRGRFEPHGRAPVPIEESHYIAVDSDAEIVEAGADVEAPERLLRPAEGDEVVTRGEVELTWTAVEGATGYVVVFGETEAEAVEHTTGSNRIALQLPEGRYAWHVRALTEIGRGHASDTGSFRVRVDRTPPTLTLRRPSPGQVVRGPIAEVLGQTERGASVEVDGVSVPVEEDGSFHGRTSIPRGLTNIVVVSRDALGNQRAVTRSVLRQR